MSVYDEHFRSLILPSKSNMNAPLDRQTGRYTLQMRVVGCINLYIYWCPWEGDQCNILAGLEISTFYIRLLFNASEKGNTSRLESESEKKYR